MNFFQNIDFIKILAKDTPGSRVIEVRNSQEVKVYGIITSRFGVQTAEFLPFGLYLELPDPGSFEGFVKDVLNLGFSRIIVTPDPICQHLSAGNIKKIFTDSGFKVIPMKTNILRTDRDFMEVTADFNDTRSKHIRRSMKNSSLTVIRTNEAKFFSRYYELYLHSAARWGKGSRLYSRNMIVSLAEVPNIRLYAALLNGEMISGMIVFLHPDGVFDWLAASLLTQELRKTYASSAVQYAVIEDACKSGKKYVNMGGNIGLEGVHYYKDSWGAVELDYFSFEYISGMAKTIRNLKNLVKK